MTYQRLILVLAVLASVVTAACLLEPGIATAVTATILMIFREVDHKITDGGGGAP